MAAEDLLWFCRFGTIILSILLFIILSQFQQISAQNMLSYKCTNTIGNYTQDSLFHRNLNIIISDPYKLPPSTITLGYGIDSVNAIAFCGRDRYVGDIDGGLCERCLTDAANELTKVCPVQKEGIVWYDDCMFRYSNKSINGTMSLTPFYKNISTTVVATDDAYWFSRNLTALADRLLVKASNSYDYYKFAADDDIYNPNGVSIYGHMECTRDISSIDCKSCLNHTKNELLSCCDHIVGARYNTPSCSFRFETYPFRYQTAENMLSYKCTNTIGNYTQGSIFHTILNDVISDPSGFNNLTLGKGIDRVNAMAFCGHENYVYGTICNRCMMNAAKVLTKVCPLQKEAVIWFEDCMFRYSNNSILGKMSITPFYKESNSTVVAANKAYWFSRNLTALADRLLLSASSNDSCFNGYKHAASDEIDCLNGEYIYGYMGCTPDISALDCRTCLNHIKNELLSCCDNVVGARYGTPSCTFRFKILSQDIWAFAKLVDMPGSTSKKAMIIVSVVVSLLVLTLSLCVFTTRRWKKANSGHKGEENEELLKNLRTETMQYDLVTIRAATEEFSAGNRLGRGGFGEVYKGVLSDGKEIAVKRLSATSGQGNEEFKNEVLLLARLQHSCLVKLLGFCLDKKERLLVYEFMANGSLDKVLFGQENRSRLDWEGRYKVIKSIARGLLYLHEDSRLMIIHRDLKTSNILLDGDMNAKISDFGMARLFDREEGEVITKRIAGTLGYMAPEYAMYGLFSMKSDVYSYGVLLLEIICGKRIYYSMTEDTSEGLLSHAYKLWKDGNASDLIDPMLTASSDSLEIMLRCIHLALLCVQDNVGSRPTMASVNLMLRSLTSSLSIPFEPGFFNGITKSWLSELLESNAHNDPLSNEETDSYLYPR